MVQQLFHWRLSTIDIACLVLLLKTSAVHPLNLAFPAFLESCSWFSTPFTLLWVCYTLFYNSLLLFIIYVCSMVVSVVSLYQNLRQKISSDFIQLNLSIKWYIKTLPIIIGCLSSKIFTSVYLLSFCRQFPSYVSKMRDSVAYP